MREVVAEVVVEYGEARSLDVPTALLAISCLYGLPWFMPAGVRAHRVVTLW